MNLFIYIIAFPLIWLISRLPFWMLYGVSDFLYFVLYTLLKYRVKVVRKNLRTAFPFKTETELLDINTKEIIYVSEPIAVVERDDSFTRLRDLKVSENKVYILDSNHTLHIFEREE